MINWKQQQLVDTEQRDVLDFSNIPLAYTENYLIVSSFISEHIKFFVWFLHMETMPLCKPSGVFIPFLPMETRLN